mmetsp:Transcript_7334/g.18751  ORF Transcript_7334/g.18751 Transcript_7334/m.18751 type:complete len:296 (+) Transcript_7334:558-1445(+)
MKLVHFGLQPRVLLLLLEQRIARLELPNPRLRGPDVAWAGMNWHALASGESAGRHHRRHHAHGNLHSLSIMHHPAHLSWGRLGELWRGAECAGPAHGSEGSRPAREGVRAVEKRRLLEKRRLRATLPEMVGLATGRRACSGSGIGVCVGGRRRRPHNLLKGERVPVCVEDICPSPFLSVALTPRVALDIESGAVERRKRRVGKPEEVLGRRTRKARRRMARHWISGWDQRERLRRYHRLHLRERISRFNRVRPPPERGWGCSDSFFHWKKPRAKRKAATQARVCWLWRSKNRGGA